MKRLLASLPFFLLIVGAAQALTILTYNVENLFDDKDDGTEFPEFDPSKGRWNTDLFHMRVETIAEVVRKSTPGGPDILVLQEVENQNALRVLLDNGLKGMGYVSSVILPKKRLAANVAVASRLPISRVLSYAVRPWKRNPVRDVIEVEIGSKAGTLHLFDDHWKSKAGGVKVTEGSRLESAGIVARRIREILREDPAADIVVAGDLNENMDEYARVGRTYQTALIPAAEKVPATYAASSVFLTDSAAEAARAAGTAGDGARVVLYEPWYELSASGRGSYYYQGEWETMDHMLLSSGLFDSRGFHYRARSFTVLRLPFLLRRDGTPQKWEHAKGNRGYSDHLPLLLTLDETN